MTGMNEEAIESSRHVNFTMTLTSRTIPLPLSAPPHLLFPGMDIFLN